KIQALILELRTTVATLNDLQRLVGTINWVRPLLGITNQDVSPLFTLLKGDPSLTSP
ncbi:POK18 protein, partial [Steatornis caripensis]|nr:POK18 protein [Steatornis caripensis]